MNTGNSLIPADEELEKLEVVEEPEKPKPAPGRHRLEFVWEYTGRITALFVDHLVNDITDSEWGHLQNKLEKVIAEIRAL
jgi:hypothetical protein